MLFSCTSSDKQKKYETSYVVPKETKIPFNDERFVTIDFAQSVIDRAKQLTRHISEEGSRLLCMEVLTRMRVYMADSASGIDIQNGDTYILMIIDRTLQPHFKARKDGATPFRFLKETFEKKGIVAIDMDLRIRRYADDLDAIAVVLLHEIRHVEQARVGSYRERTRSALTERETDAWNLQAHVYFSEHPEVLEMVDSCDCNTLEPAWKNGLVIKDALVWNMINFAFCREQFINKVY